jgi:serine/threonine protein kinase
LRVRIGGSLEDRLRKSPEPLPDSLLLRWMGQVASGLHELHRAGLAHRNLTAQNVLLTGVSQASDAKLCDFGCVMSRAQGGLAAQAKLSMEAEAAALTGMCNRLTQLTPPHTRVAPTH